MLDALMAYNGSLFGPSLVAIALLLTMGVMATFSRTRIPALVMVWMGLLAAVGSLGVSWFSMLQIRSIFFSNGVHVPILEHLAEVEAATSILLVLNGCSWALVGWIAGIAVYRMRSPTFPIPGLTAPEQEDSRVS
jgi:hypothetical protein